ncbi:GTP cyclohydrolase I FolE [uncultured Agrococcus sp.]|uniref:GTP cyclohydrolase I FolE n=1 Tax=uncultured Agrococcus sp. TaxID=382258 RepID=UPI0025D58FB0|nr:GTP cyclohydrolase I FolE [uncultured Agrococcus sp.]
MAIDRDRVQRAVLELLEAIGDDPAREGLGDTPRRVADAYAEFFAGVGVDAGEHLIDQLDVGDDTGELVLLRDIAFRSICEHHLLPFTGIAHVAYIPDEKIVGLGRLPAVVTTTAARPQIQERLTEEIADTFEAGLRPKGVLIVIDATHGCVAARGSRQERSSTVTMASRGVLTEPLQRAEIMALIGERSGR